MSLILKKIIHSLTFNTCLFFLLLIGIQNSSNKTKVNFLINETVKLPISFIIGTNFICGSLIGSFLSINLGNNNG
jgi:uncharacterized integral membrane protein